MTRKQKLELRASEIRTRLAELGGLETLEDEQRAELDRLRTEYGDTERQIGALAIAEDEPTETKTEDRQRAELRARVNVASYVTAAAEMRAVAGAEAEYNGELGIGLDRFPLELLAPVEERATTDVDSGRTQTGWLDRLFAESAAARLGLTFASVGAGTTSYPVTTAGATGVQRGKEEAVTAASWTISASELKPSRNAVRMTYTMEDAARLGGLSEALTRDLRMGLMEAVDKAVFLGDSGATGTDADITGLQTATGVVEQTVTQANKIKGPETLEAFSALVDGKHAVNFGDLRTVATVGAWRLWESTVINATADNMTLAAFLRTAGLSWSSRGDIEEATTNGKFGAFIGRARGLPGAGVIPVWDSGQLIRDPYGGAAKGEIALTLNYLWNFGLPRATNFARIKFVT